MDKQFDNQLYHSDYDFVQNFALYEKEVLSVSEWIFNTINNPNCLMYYIKINK